jgi:hypothetical protein
MGIEDYYARTWLEDTICRDVAINLYKLLAFGGSRKMIKRAKPERCILASEAPRTLRQARGTSQIKKGAK